MLIKEYRIALPFSIDEYQKGQLYSVAEMSKQQTGGGEGVEVLEQKSFTSSTLRMGKITSGTYTKKIYRLKSKVPYILKKMMPENAFTFCEESWNAFPYTKTIVTVGFYYLFSTAENEVLQNPDYMKENFVIVLESIHEPDNGEKENALNLKKDDLKKREIVYLDIANDDHLRKSDLTEENDLRKLKSRKTGRGPLRKNWITKQEPLITAYKVVSVHFKWFGFQNRVENMVHKNYPRLFVKFHRDMFCWMDEWISMTMDEIRVFEEEAASLLRQQLECDRIKGMTADSDDKNNDESTSTNSEEKGY